MIPLGGIALHWMIAEDEADIRNLVATMTQVWGHIPVTFDSGTKAWEFLDQVEAGSYGDPLPDFALMDIRMPGYRGDQIAKRIRETSGIQHIPIVLMTAFVLSDEEKDSMMNDSGVDLILHKPLPDFMELKTILEGVISDKQSGN